MRAQETRQSFHWKLILLLMLMPALAGGCVGAYRLLPSEDQVPELSELKEMARGIPLTTHRVPVTAPNGRVVHVALHESGPAGADRVIVLIHGVLSDAQLWRFVRGGLGGEYRVILVDLPGGGASDAPSPHDLGSDGYGPEALSTMVLQALQKHFEQTESPRQITLVGHSLGGLLAVWMMGDESIGRRYASVLDRVDGAVLFTPIDVALEKKLPVFEEIVRVTDVEVSIAQWTGILRQKAAEATLNGVSDPSRAVREEADRTYNVLATPAIRHAQQAILRQVIRWKGGRPNWEWMERITARYGGIQTPCLIVWGSRDELFPVSMGCKLVIEIPQSRLQIVPEAMHSLPTEHPALCAEIIRDFVASGAEREKPLAMSPFALNALSDFTSAWRVAAGWLGTYLFGNVERDRNQDTPRERISRTPPTRRPAADAAG